MKGQSEDCSTPSQQLDLGSESCHLDRFVWSSHCRFCSRAFVSRLPLHQTLGKTRCYSNRCQTPVSSSNTVRTIDRACRAHTTSRGSLELQFHTVTKPYRPGGHRFTGIIQSIHLAGRHFIRKGAPDADKVRIQSAGSYCTSASSLSSGWHA